jgi:2-phospho-L-lactate/phosphoenolpyruvate guanylyltransferase
MKVWLITPVKPFAEGKSRLAPVLSDPQRYDLNRQLLHNLLDRAQATQLFAGVIVVGRDPQVLADVTWDRVSFAQETEPSPNGTPHSLLNRALEQARQRALQANADAILILPADLPLLTSTDITHLSRLGQTPATMVIAPSQDGGTNALLLHPPQGIPFAFGHHSFARHCTLAEQANLPYRIFESPTLSFDLDWPEDLAALADNWGVLSPGSKIQHPKRSDQAMRL